MRIAPFFYFRTKMANDTPQQMTLDSGNKNIKQYLKLLQQARQEVRRRNNNNNTISLSSPVDTPGRQNRVNKDFINAFSAISSSATER